jgi:hypothetical protein
MDWACRYSAVEMVNLQVVQDMNGPSIQRLARSEVTSHPSHDRRQAAKGGDEILRFHLLHHQRIKADVDVKMPCWTIQAE